MVRQKKRGFILASAIFALITSLVVFLMNILVFASRTMEKITSDSSTPEGSSLLGDILPDVQDFITFLKGTSEEKTFVLINIAFIVISIVLFILAIKAMKSPVLKDGSVTYRPGLMFVISLIAIAIAAVYFLGYSYEEIANYGLAQTICLVPIATSALVVLWAICALFVKKNVFKTKVVLEAKKDQKFTPIVLGVEEKLKKIQQLKDVGAITEAQYNAAVIRLLNSI